MFVIFCIDPVADKLIRGNLSRYWYAAWPQKSNYNGGNESRENLSIVSEKTKSTGKLRKDEKIFINESESGIHNEVEQAKQTDEKIEDDTFQKYRNIIEDLLNQQTEVKLTEINSKIKKHFSNENKTVGEIKKIIIVLKIQVETVTGKTNTIKRINS